jgi:hypothetical protein
MNSNKGYVRIVHSLKRNTLFVAVKVGIGNKFFHRWRALFRHSNEERRDRYEPSSSFLSKPASASLASSIMEGDVKERKVRIKLELEARQVCLANIWL